MPGLGGLRRTMCSLNPYILKSAGTPATPHAAEDDFILLARLAFFSHVIEFQSPECALC